LDQLRRSLANEARLAHEKDVLIEQQELLSAEANHRLLNNMQIIASLLTLQSRTSVSAETASQLAAAAHRVSTIERIHRRLHSIDGVQTVAFKSFLEDFSRDFAALLFADGEANGLIEVEGDKMDLPAATAVPLAFIANELITNAAKYGGCRIAVTLRSNPQSGNVLTVTNDGPSLPAGFSPAARRGLGMRIVQSFAQRIAGELEFGPGEDGQGARFAVRFP
jgi:two-component sensor histidine kinase